MSTEETNFDSSFDYKTVEPELLKFWEEGKWFHAPVDSKKKPFTVLLPPPNVTARLHMGHGLNVTIQDILVRWKRMSGDNACWLPGTDHAGIATQMMVERSLGEQGIKRTDLGRAAFFAKCEEWKNENGGAIIDQLKKLGASCDWDKLAYTMDPKRSEAVRHVFVKLFEDGLIYRGERLVNWDVALQTAISDDEIESIEVDSQLFHIAYLLADDDGQPLVVATTRPETMFGDTAVAVNPNDERFSSYIGKKVRIPFTDKIIPVIGDEYVKMDFGTGCLKITPAHDPNDFLIGKKHNLPFITILDEKGALNALCPAEFVGLDRFEARKKLVKELKTNGQLIEVKSHRNALPHSERSKTVIEPRLSKQWYVKMAELAKPALDAGLEGQIKFHPEHYLKTYSHWLSNIQDWCISRQLWWGHRIPIWTCQECKHVQTGVEDPTNCAKCSSKNIKQDEDVLDTWFSSWLWPLSPFGWPEETAESKYFFPSNVLVTGAEIIFLWVARMVMVSQYFRKEVSFKDVYFNSIICDKQGRKFSKTLGNGIDPLELIEKHGADAVRFTCVSLAPLGGRVKMDREDFDLGSRFVNKIWNGARFLKSSLGVEKGAEKLIDFKEEDLCLADKWLLEEFYRISETAQNHLTRFEINEYVACLYHFFWGSYCDWGVEAAKISFKQTPQVTSSVMCYVFEGALRLLHPVVPFVTETIWQQLPLHPRWPRPKSIAVADFPKVLPKRSVGQNEAYEQWSQIQNVISQVRSLRTQAKFPMKEKLKVYLRADEKLSTLLLKQWPWFEKLAHVEKLVTLSAHEKTVEKTFVSTGSGFSVLIPVPEGFDVDGELKRLNQEQQRIGQIIKGLGAKLASESFVSKAPEDVIAQTKAQFENMTQQLKQIQICLESLGE